MSILVGQGTRVLVQGITGGAGSFHTKQMLDYGTEIVAGSTPGRGGETFEGKVPVFNTAREAVRATGADTSVIFVPPPFAADSVLEWEESEFLGADSVSKAEGNTAKCVIARTWLTRRGRGT